MIYATPPAIVSFFKRPPAPVERFLNGAFKKFLEKKDLEKMFKQVKSQEAKRIIETAFERGGMRLGQMAGEASSEAIVTELLQAFLFLFA